MVKRNRKGRWTRKKRIGKRMRMGQRKRRRRKGTGQREVIRKRSGEGEGRWEKEEGEEEQEEEKILEAGWPMGGVSGTTQLSGGRPAFPFRAPSNDLTHPHRRRDPQPMCLHRLVWPKGGLSLFAFV